MKTKIDLKKSVMQSSLSQGVNISTAKYQEVATTNLYLKTGPSIQQNIFTTKA